MTQIAFSLRHERIGVQRWGRIALALGIIAVAFHTSLRTLLDALSLDTPVAHLALVPLIAGGLALSSRHTSLGPNIHDRQLDWIVGLPLIVLALFANLLLPARMSTQYWLWRIDLLTLPIFAAGVVILVFGIRQAWRARIALLFLFLAWPFPYNAALDQWLGRFTQLTIAGVDQALAIAPVASNVANSDSLYAIAHRGQSIKVEVASSCSGANGLVGFLLVGLAFVLVVEGRRWRKVAWLLAGALLVWLLNVLRIWFIFYAVKRWGEDVAIDGLHPFVGLVVFNIGIAVMVLLMRRFGLRFRLNRPTAARADAAGPTLAASAPLKRHAPPLLAATMIVVGAGLGLGFLNASLQENDLISTSLGAPRLAGFADSRETPDSWRLDNVASMDWARRFFGKDSNWSRYSYQAQDVSSALYSNVPITLDVVSTSNRSALSAYGIKACYQFHGFSTSAVESVELGGGVVASVLTWANPDTERTYTTLYWHWPIQASSGVRYERIVLIVPDDEGTTMRAPANDVALVDQLRTGLNDVLRGDGTPERRERLLNTRSFLVAFGQDLVAKRADASA